MLRRDMYVDDIFTGTSTIEEVIQLPDESIEILRLGGLHNSTQDVIVYSVKPIHIQEKVTKRTILSEIAKIFDSLGLLGPVIVIATIIMQKIWQLKLNWDESVPNSIHIEWTNYISQLSTLNNVALPRKIIPLHAQRIELHGFCDASERAYGACIYARATQADEVISWQFIRPSSPHFGGLWESAVKGFKHHMRRVVGDQLFTFEEFNTFVIEVEAILNSRPLTPISTDPNDIIVLTPGHFLIGDSLTSIPESDFRSTASNRLSNWQHIQKVKQDFWTRWHKEYLNELNVRHKWTRGEHNIKEGSIVLIKEDNLPPMQWALGRVINVKPGKDGIVRAVTVKTVTNALDRCVKKLAPLPIEG
ncbi:uncharacterized protein LOC105697791 [Orussus abietinus]|uniref:uncharacterized protein LOC105697791 n=1 Tax=Orussus abietinus TaxID=222816 RepID=UPI000626E606|nr:uncharacterized protein LOC105697791 [Orussus abietinus]